MSKTLFIYGLAIFVAVFLMVILAHHLPQPVVWGIAFFAMFSIESAARRREGPLGSVMARCLGGSFLGALATTIVGYVLLWLIKN